MKRGHSGLFVGRDVLITGTSKGFGKEIARGFLQYGARVFGVSRTTPIWLAGVNDKPKAHYFHFIGDISNSAHIDDFFDFIEKNNGCINILINNAGYFSGVMPIADISRAQWNTSLSTNLTGAFLVTQKALPMLQLTAPSCVVNVSSSVTQNITTGWSDYVVSKAGLEALSRMIAKEQANNGIKAFSVWPRKLNTDMRRMAHPNENPNTLHAPAVAATSLIGLIARSFSEDIPDVIDLSVYYSEKK